MSVFISGCNPNKQARDEISQSGSKSVAKSEDLIRIEGDEVFYRGKLLANLPAKSRQQMQDLLQKAKIYPKLPDGTLVPEITQLPDNKIFLSGGVGKNNTYSVNTWIFDEKTGKLNAGPQLVRESIKHATLLLSDGRILISGGATARPVEIDKIQIYDPSQNQIKASGTLIFPRYEHAMTEISPGIVVITGGATRNGDGDEVELFDLKSAKSRLCGKMKQPRKQHDCLKAGENTVILLGGLGYEHTGEPLEAEQLVIRENK